MCYSPAVVFVGIDAGFPPQIPHSHAGVQGARCKELTKWVKIYTETAGAVASQGSDHCTCNTTLLSCPRGKEFCLSCVQTTDLFKGTVLICRKAHS